MKRKPIKVDWDELEEVFSRPHDEIDSYLDLVTGQVVLDGEGEEDDLDPDDDNFSAHPPPVSAPRADVTRLAVHPPDTTTKLGWMDEFLEANAGRFGEAHDLLADAMKADDPAGAIGSLLNRHAEVRDQWYLFRADRIHEQIERWLAENGVAPASPPPWS